MTARSVNGDEMRIGAERFVRAFHARWPGATSAAYARGRADGDGRSSYELLADAVPAGARVLDLGGGDGFLCSVLAARGARPIGLDLSREEVARAGEPAVVARAEAIPIADGAFDACVSHLAFSILPDPAAAAREVARVLRPGGVFAIATGGGPARDLADHPDDGLAILFALARPFLAAVPEARRAPRLGDVRARHAEGLDALLGPAGFAPCTWRAHTVDLGGAAEDVWATLATIYELAPLDDGARDELRRAFLTHARGDRVPCTLSIPIATARTLVFR